MGVKDIVQDTYHTFKGTTFREGWKGKKGAWVSGGREGNGSDRALLVVQDEEGTEYERPGRRVRWSDKLLTRDRDGNDEQTSNYDDEAKADTVSLEFPDVEEDGDLEAAYERSRELVFGDYNFPVMSEDARAKHPPLVQRRIDEDIEKYKGLIGVGKVALVERNDGAGSSVHVQRGDGLTHAAPGSSSARPPVIAKEQLRGAAFFDSVGPEGLDTEDAEGEFEDDAAAPLNKLNKDSWRV